jgi:hypothetical protein
MVDYVSQHPERLGAVADDSDGVSSVWISPRKHSVSASPATHLKDDFRRDQRNIRLAGDTHAETMAGVASRERAAAPRASLKSSG